VPKELDLALLLVTSLTAPFEAASTGIATGKSSMQ